MFRVSNFNLETFNRRGRVTSYFNICKAIRPWERTFVQGVLKGCSMPQIQSHFSYLIVNAEISVAFVVDFLWRWVQPRRSRFLIVQFYLCLWPRFFFALHWYAVSMADDVLYSLLPFQLSLSGSTFLSKF